MSAKILNLLSHLFVAEIHIPRMQGTIRCIEKTYMLLSLSPCNAKCFEVDIPCRIRLIPSIPIKYNKHIIDKNKVAQNAIIETLKLGIR